MNSYMHTNSSSMPPTMTGDALAIYRTIVAGLPVTISVGHYTPDDLCLVAERLRCDAAAAALAKRGVYAQVIDRETIGTYVEAAVNIIPPGGGTVSVDAEAALRMVQRIDSGLSADDAIARTLAQCSAPVLSEGALRQMEREADHVQRELARPMPLRG